MIRIENVRREYTGRSVQSTVAVDGVSLSIEKGELVALMGPSGSGKSTLLNLIGGLDRPTEGGVEVAGRPLSDMSNEQLDQFRLDTIGFVFQQFYLMPNFSVAENVALSAMIKNRPRRSWLPRVEELLGLVGLSDKIDDHPNKLSGGQQQRVAVCRALFGHPPLILADEPTGNLDSVSAVAVLQLIRDAIGPAAETTGVLVTHDPEAAAFADRIVHLHDGRIVRVEPGGGHEHAQRVGSYA